MAGVETSLTAVAVVGLIIYVLALYSDISSDLMRAKKCDTTYIHPSYEKITLAVEGSTGFFPRYSVYRYQEKNSYWVPTEVTQKRNDGAVPVLFVHGHLGSYEQMRSMASETAKELSRRFRKGNEIRWVDWYGVDFDGEPSGLEPRLLVNQAKYVEHCLQYLRTKANKVVLVGYSMGGLVVDTVVDQDSDSVLFAITIGSPHFHLPSFVMPRKSFGREYVSDEFRTVPMLHVYSGPGDVLVPAISAWSVHSTRRHNLTLEVDMDNIPGVWGTSTHKGLVSCNQLVRQTVPLILDSINLAYAGGTSHDIYAAMRNRMTSSIDFSSERLGTVNLLPGEPEGAHNCKEMSKPIQVVKHGECVFHTLKDDEDLVQILAHGLHPGVSFNLFGVKNEGYFDMSHMFSPLPALSVTEPKENTRFWKDIIQGIDWMENSTWVLEVRSAAIRDEGANTVQLYLGNQGNPLPGQGIVVSFKNETARTFNRLDERIKGAGVAKLDIQSIFSRLQGVAGWFVPKQLISWKVLADLFPIKLVLNNLACLSTSDAVEKEIYSESLLVSVNTETGIEGDHFRRAVDGTNKLNIPLWHPSVLSSDMFAIIDPRCTYSISLGWDFYSAMIYSTRHQIYAMPGILVAFALLRCIPLYASNGKIKVQTPNLGRFAALSLIVTAQSVIVSRLLNAFQRGTVPWIFLQTPTSTISMLWLTLMVDAIIKIVLCAWINLSRIWMDTVCAWFHRIHGLKLGIIILTIFLLHDFASFFVSGLIIVVASLSDSVSRDHLAFFPLEWFTILLYGVSPMAVAMFGGKFFGYSHRIQYSLFSVERILIGVISLSSVAVVTSMKSPQTQRAISPFQFLRVLCANSALLGSLFGFNYLPPFLVAFVCLAEYIHILYSNS